MSKNLVQHTEYQRLLSEHNITQSMSKKGNCMDNGIMKNFFGRLKVEIVLRRKIRIPLGDSLRSWKNTYITTTMKESLLN